MTPTNPRIHMRIEVDTTALVHAMRDAIRTLRHWDLAPTHRAPRRYHSQPEPLAVDGHAYRRRVRSRRRT